MNSTDQDGNTLLSMAILNQSIHTVNLLLGYGADIKKQNHDGTTALHMATGWHAYLNQNMMMEP